MVAPLSRIPLWISTYRYHYLFSRRFSTKKVPLAKNKETLEHKLDGLLRDINADNSSGKQQEVLDIANTVLKQNIPFQQEVSIIRKLSQFKPVHETFWTEYAAKLDKRLNALYKLGHKSDPAEQTSDEPPMDNGDINMKNLLQVSRSLATQKVTSIAVAELFVRWIKNNSYHLIPNRMSTFNGMLEYLSHVGHRGNLKPEDFDVVAECVVEVKHQHLVDILYFLSILNIKNEAMITTVGRALHNEIAKGKLSPSSKTKLSRAYAMLKHEHITFFKHIAEELRVIFEGKDDGKYLDVIHDVGKRWVNGIGYDEPSQPSGVLCDVLPYMRTETDCEEQSQVGKVEFTGTKDQLYTDGQLIYILDSMMYLNLHHVEPYFNRLLNSAIKHCYSTTSLDQFDAEQLRSSITLLAHCRKTVDSNILEAITRRFVQSYIDGKATNSQLALFLKDLVKQTRKVVKTVNRRNRVCFKSNFLPPTWLDKPLSAAGNIASARMQPSIIEACCTKLCENVYSFTMGDLTSVIRSIAYLGFKNDSIYQAFIPYFKECVAKLTHVDIANITQALTKVNVRDDHLFYLMGKQHQLYLHGMDKAHTLYVKRIG
ncbi:hypothetical protein BgAZ_404600 [Babesia gibsoni]|uniref:Uncharacterized protein n=1 Tax=Babesia gibsoni TaxID=33632 RepID=A0AAD8LGW9_BABGI|nr:hypothetical protein BgAZ_404600 [Babesia gibsoni]